MKTSKRSIIIVSAIILAGNALYVLLNIPSDGRWIYQLPITSIFATIYLAIIYLIARNSEANNKSFFIILHSIIAFSFFIFGSTIELAFQNNDFLYLKHYIAIAPYLILYAIGIVVSCAIAKMIKA